MSKKFLIIFIVMLALVGGAFYDYFNEQSNQKKEALSKQLIGVPLEDIIKVEIIDGEFYLKSESSKKSESIEKLENIEKSEKLKSKTDTKLNSNSNSDSDSDKDVHLLGRGLDEDTHLTNTGVTLEKQGHLWTITHPLVEPSDEPSVNDFLKSITQEKYDKKLSRSFDFKDDFYGFNQPLGVLKVSTQNSQEPLIFLLAKNKNFEGSVYLKSEKGTEVYLASSVWQTYFEKKIFDFRKKSLFSESLASLEKWQIKNSNVNFKFEKVTQNKKFSNVKDSNTKGSNTKGPVARGKSGDNTLSNNNSENKQTTGAELNNKDKTDESKKIWTEVKHSDILLDSSKIQEFLYTLSQPMITEFVSESDPTNEQKIKWDLIKPLVTLKLDLPSGVWVSEFYKSKQGYFYVWIKNRHQVVKIAQSDFDKMNGLNLRQLRDYSFAFAFDKNKAKSVSLESNNQSVDYLWLENKWALGQTSLKHQEPLNNNDIKNEVPKSDEKKNEQPIRNELGKIDLALLIDQINLLTIDQFKEELGLSFKSNHSSYVKNYAVNFYEEDKNLFFSLDFYKAIEVNKNDGKMPKKGEKQTARQASKKLIPVKSSLFNDIVFILESDFNKLQLDRFFKPHKTNPVQESSQSSQSESQSESQSQSAPSASKTEVTK